MNRIAELDGVRFLAIFLVVFAHFFNPVGFPGKTFVQPLLNFGWSGVDLFFVLSGYLVGTIVLKQISSPVFMQVFYLRRFLRIIPLYYLYLLACFTLTAIDATPKSVPWWAFMTHLQPLWMAWTGTQTYYYLNISWSLGIEEYFYLALPFLVLWLSRKSLVRSCIALLALLPAARGLLSIHPEFHLACTLLRPDGLIFGVLIAALLNDADWAKTLSQNGHRIVGLWWGLLAGIVAMQWGSVQFYYSHFPLIVSGIYPWLSAFYGVSLLLVLLKRTPGWVRTGLTFRPVTEIGKRAYFIYLFHMVVYTAVGGHSLATALGSLVVVLTLSFVSWKWLERPLIEVGHSFVYSPQNLRQHRLLKLESRIGGTS